MTDTGAHPALEYVMAAVHDVLTEEDLAAFRPAVEALVDQFDAIDVAAAALRLAYEVAPNRPPRVIVLPGAGSGRGAANRRPGRDPRDDRPRRDPRPGDPDVAQLYVNVGRMDRVRPADLVGAIAGETGLQGSEIGAINIFEKFSLVEVPDDAVDDVIDRMTGVVIRGRQTEVRRDRGPKH